LLRVVLPAGHTEKAHGLDQDGKNQVFGYRHSIRQAQVRAWLQNQCIHSISNSRK
jgi:hypothetical protein